MNARNLFDQLLKTAEAQHLAARRVDGVALARLARERAMIQDQISMPALIAMNPADRAYAKGILLRVRELDRRIRCCAQLVIDSISTIVPAAAPMVYNARGYLRGG